VNPSEALDYLQSLGLELRPGRRFDLRTIQTLLAELGHPERQFASVHIAGTNGKGSVAALVEAAARTARIRTGLYTSPHLQRLTERIRIRGEEIAPQELAPAASAVRAAAERLLAAGRLDLAPSFFEIVTAVGMLAFARAGIELGVIEVGLGGRLDATNVLAPRVAVFTPIGLDHEAYLGSTVSAIAAEKAGILKPGIPRALSAIQTPEAAAVLAERAAAAGVPLRALTAADIAAAPATALRGRHQVENAALAAAVCAELRSQGWDLTPAAVTGGFAAARWPGRLERIAERPDVYLDGAHNPMAARALAAYLDEFRERHAAPVLIYGSMRDKAIEEICELLFPRAAAVVITAPRQPRALDPAALARACGGLAPAVETAPDYPSALAAARRRAGAEGAIFVTGSLYLVGEAREHGVPPA